MRGSHATYKRTRKDGNVDVATVVLDKKDLPFGTTDAILKQANVTYDEALKALKQRKKS